MSTTTDTDIEARAQELIDTGKFMDFWTKTYHRQHIGDDAIAIEMPCANLTYNIKNSTGISTIQITGESGNGKSHGAILVGKMMGRYCETEGMSPMALLYLAKDGLVEPGTVRILDDNRGNTGQWDIIKRNSTEFRTGYKYSTVINQKAVTMQLPAGLTIITTEVNAESEEEVLNRTDPIEVSGNLEKDESIMEADSRRLYDDKAETDIGNDIAICQRCWEMLKANTYIAVLPAGVKIDWRERDDKGRVNHRNRHLMEDLMMALAAINYKQRDHTVLDDGTIRVVINKEDFDTARELYRAKSKQIVTKLTAKERLVVNYTAGHKRVLKSQVEQDLKITSDRMSQLLHGKKSNGTKTMGIADKVIGFEVEYINEPVESQKGQLGNARRCYLKYSGKPISESEEITWPAQWVERSN